jgi:hypothetical protein
MGRPTRIMNNCTRGTRLRGLRSWWYQATMAIYAPTVRRATPAMVRAVAVPGERAIPRPLQRRLPAKARGRHGFGPGKRSDSGPGGVTV